MPSPIIYLASPYSHLDPAVVTQRVAIVCRMAARLMREGHIVFSPIAHSHAIAVAGGLPTDWTFWERYDRAMLAACAELWIANIDGWQYSKGIAGEIAIFSHFGRPIRHVEPTAEDLGERPCGICGLPTRAADRECVVCSCM